MAELLLGIDIGTGSSKAVLTDPRGTVVAQAVIEHETDNPRPGWFEHDPETLWWGETVRLCRQVVSKSGRDASEIAGVGVSAIGPCLVPLDDADRPLRPGILYGVDTRATRQIDELHERIGREAIVDHSHMDLSSQAIVPKMQWLRQEEPEVWKRTRTVTTASSFIVHRLTGEHRIDPHQAGHFHPFFDPGSMQWTDAFADELAGFDMLPPVQWPTEAAGTVTASAAAETELDEGTPVAVGTVDAAAEAIGVGVRRPGDLMIMYGTTMFFILITPEPVTVPGAWLVGGLEPSQYNVAAGMATSGALTEWVRALTLEGGSRADGYGRLFAEAADIPAGSEGLLLLPYFEGERTPLNDSLATGVVAGLGLGHGRGHLMRAALEGVAYGARHNIEAFAEETSGIDRVVAVGGGTTSSLWMQIVSDVTGLPQVVPAQRIGAALGDAFIAGVAAGLHTVDTIDEWAVDHTTITPSPDQDLYDELYLDYHRLHEATVDIQHRLRGRRVGQPAGT